MWPRWPFGRRSALAIGAAQGARTINAGHFGLAAAVKSRAPFLPLWAAMMATQWLDIVFVPLVLAGIERFETLPGAHPGAYGELVIFADYTHSLIGALVLSAAFGGALAWRYGAQAGYILAGLSFSHWLLDLVVHRADMPILPGAWGDLPRLGFGLWALALPRRGCPL